MPYFFVVLLFAPTFGGLVRVTTRAVSEPACQDSLAVARDDYLAQLAYELAPCAPGTGEAELLPGTTRLTLVDLDRKGRKVVVVVEFVSPEACERGRRVATRLAGDVAVLSECEAGR